MTMRKRRKNFYNKFIFDELILVCYYWKAFKSSKKKEKYCHGQRGCLPV